jgi:phenylpropionate dioxygenase-like ring-hydroxylating dioxygenase large terminal subunit
MFLRNAWYVAAWDHEVSAERPFGRTLLNEPVVLYRTRDGRAVALEDRCCHRHFPLRFGSVAGDCLQCGYHGFTYDATGKCVRVPGQANGDSGQLQAIRCPRRRIAAEREAAARLVA